MCIRDRCKPTSEIQQKLNQKNAEKKLTRLVHSKFTEDDIALHLTYHPGEEPQTEEEAQHILCLLYTSRKKSEKYGLTVYLCHGSCHIFGEKEVHSCRETMDELHRYGQKMAMERCV